jgi:transposase
MKQSTAFVGLDVHKDSISVALVSAEGDAVEVGQFENTPTVVQKLVLRLTRMHSSLSFAYEAGPCGYGLYRQLKKMGHECLVAAPSLIPKRPGDRIKTDRRDAMSLARLLRMGELTAVWVPAPHHEAVRDLVRCRDDFKQAERRCRQRMCGFLLRHGRHYDKNRWTQAHRLWLKSQQFDHQELQKVFDHYLHGIMESEERIVQLEREMAGALNDWSLAALVRGLMAMRGIKLVTSMTLASELGDLTRFSRPEDLMSFVGLVASERSSGQTRRQGGITKSGNRQVRRVMIESAWSYRHKPCISASLRARSQDASEAVRAIAWKAQKRLYKRYHRLTSLGKAAQVAVTAVAREGMGFIWAIGWQVMKEQQSSATAGV